MKIELNNVTKKYSSSNERDALKSVSLSFDRSGLTFILGKSGSGKTTLLNIIAGLDSPTEGNVLYDGADTSSFSEDQWDHYRNLKMGFVFQDFNLLPDLTVWENVMLALKIRKTGKDDRDERVAQAMKECAIYEKKDKKISELSGGEKQRVAIARAIVKGADLILADEPTGNLDSENAKIIFGLLKKVSKDHAVIIVSHDISAAEEYADRVIKIKDGIVESDIAGTNGSDTANLTQVPEKLEESAVNLKNSDIIRLSLSNLKKKIIRFIACVIAFSLVNVLLMSFISVLKNNYSGRISRYLKKHGNPLEMIALNDTSAEAEYGKCNGYEAVNRIESIADKNRIVFFCGEKMLSAADFETTYGYSDQTDGSSKKRIFETGVVVLNNGDRPRFEIEGRFPSDRNEIAISEYIINKTGWNIAVGTEIYLNWEKMTVTGIVRTNENVSAFDTENKQYYDMFYNKVCYVDMSYYEAQRNRSLDGEALLLPSSDFSLCNYRNAYIKSSSYYGNAAGLAGDELICGRLPEKDSEILVSESYANLLGINVWKPFNEVAVTVRNINDYSIKDNIKYFDVALYLTNEVTVCGVVPDAEAEVYVASGVYRKMVEDYYDFYGYDCIGITSGEWEKNSVNAILSRNFLFLNPDIQNIISVRNTVNALSPVIRIVSLILVLISLALIIVFIFNNERDNRREIAVLRAIGVMRRDIARIFLYETGMICSISILAGVAGCYLLHAFLHTLVEDKMNWRHYFLVLTPNLPVLCAMAVILWVLFVAAAIGPIAVITRKKPVEILQRI